MDASRLKQSHVQTVKRGYLDKTFLPWILGVLALVTIAGTQCHLTQQHALAHGRGLAAAPTDLPTSSNTCTRSPYVPASTNTCISGPYEHTLDYLYKSDGLLPRPDPAPRCQDGNLSDSSFRFRRKIKFPSRRDVVSI